MEGKGLQRRRKFVICRSKGHTVPGKTETGQSIPSKHIIAKLVYFKVEKKLLQASRKKKKVTPKRENQIGLGCQGGGGWWLSH